MKKILLLLVLLSTFMLGYGQELIVDGGCEDNDDIGTEHEPNAAWVELGGSGEVKCYNAGGFGTGGTPNNGISFFGTNDENTDHTIQQVIDLGSNKAGSTFNYSYSYANAFGGTHNLTVLMEFLDAMDNDLGDLHTMTVTTASTTYSTESGVSGMAPAGTQKIRVTVTWPDPGGFHDITMDDISLTFNVNVPVTLVTFNAKAQEEVISLDWATASELENAGFEVQRSMDGKVFKTIGFVEGNGTTIEKQQYAFQDNEVTPKQFYYYRLKQVDFDGSFEYSNVVTASILGNNKTTLSVYPNPAKDILNIANGEGRALIYNMVGQIVKTVYLTDEVNTVKISELPSGQYFVKIEDKNGLFEIQQFTKQY